MLTVLYVRVKAKVRSSIHSSFYNRDLQIVTVLKVHLMGWDVRHNPAPNAKEKLFTISYYPSHEIGNKGDWTLLISHTQRKSNNNNPY